MDVPDVLIPAQDLQEQRRARRASVRVESVQVATEREGCFTARDEAEIVVKFRTEKKNSCDVNVKLEYSCER